ncbi:mitochondrial translation initiation factor-domain-containing protein [Scheffersomyces coipomensis]|uniref:mitochondrial translation initiation factor-domain-containing protein n=1 Tax=Scheffersomyces coipomensis TaxID=1788519 RepID=UPI00315CC90F
MFQSLRSPTSRGYIQASRIVLWSRSFYLDSPLCQDFKFPSSDKPRGNNNSNNNNNNNDKKNSNARDNAEGGNRFVKHFENRNNNTNNNNNNNRPFSQNRNNNTSFKDNNSRDSQKANASKFNANNRELVNRNNHRDDHYRGLSDREFDHKRKYLKQQRDRQQRDRQSQQRQQPQFVFESGSRQAISALKSLIEKVAALQTNFKVRYLNPFQNRIDVLHLSRISNTLELDKYGLSLVQNDGEEFPLIKRIDVVDMVKAYSDELAALKEKELIEAGSRAAQKAVQARNKILKKKSAKKEYAISFNISIGDLITQKKREIINLINKGQPFNLTLASKTRLHRDPNAKSTTTEGGEEEESQSVYDIRQSREFREEDALEVEYARRSMIYEQVIEYLDESPVTYTATGSMYNKFIISVTPKEESSSNNQVKKSKKDDNNEKDLKKQKKLLKQKEREQEKIQSSKSEDDLDALYSIKIDP